MKDGKRERMNPASLWVLLGGIAIVTSLATADAKTPKVPDMFVASDRCLSCHNGLITPSGQNVSIGTNWQSSMMAHSSRDPYWQASVRRESLEHPESSQAIQDECSACHMPMARYQAKTAGGKGQVFVNLPFLPVATPLHQLAVDGVSCAICHQIQPEKLGTHESFTAGFVVDTEKPLGQRESYGPYEVDAGRTRVMQSSALLVPQEGLHIQDSALCGSCHTLFTHTRAPGGEIIGELPEQVPYLEWQHSAYNDKEHCQSCHMPQLAEPMHITSVLGQDREPFSRHVFRGGNFLIPKVFNRHRVELGVAAQPQDLENASTQTLQNLAENTARLAIEQAEILNDTLLVDMRITQLAGHKLPTAYPSRRVWLHTTVSDRNGQIVFESGKFQADGSIAGNDNDADPTRFEPHYTKIQTPDQVQIYEAIMVDAEDKVTTGLLRALRFIKDNRILPEGFDKTTADDDIAVRGGALEDSDFVAGTDTIQYAVSVKETALPVTVKAQLWYQPIGFRWAQNLKEQQAEEIERFIGYYDDMAAESGTILAEASQIVEGQ